MARGTGDLRGQYYETTDATVYDHPEGGVPIYIAAGGPATAKYAGRAGDGSSAPAEGHGPVTEKLLPGLADGAAAAGRDVVDITG